jgi:hypothetical protein
MNLAFPALCILFLVLPGIIFRSAYTQGSVPVFFPPGSSGLDGVNKFPTSNRPLAEEISTSLVTAICLHILWLTACPYWLFPLHKLGWLTSVHALDTNDYVNLFRVLYGDIKVQWAHESAMRFLAESRQGLVCYFLSLYGASFILGRFSIRFIRRFKLDHKFIQVRLADGWFYFLRGEMFSFHEFRQLFQDNGIGNGNAKDQGENQDNAKGDQQQNEKDKDKPRRHVTGTYVSVVIAQADGDYLYKGFLWDFHLDGKGGLDRLVLHNAIRCKFDPANPTAASHRPRPVSATKIVEVKWAFQRVTSQIFTVKYADCKTLACTFFYIRDPAAEAARAARAQGWRDRWRKLSTWAGA